jgi:hypothetical protein
MRARMVPESVATTWTKALPALTRHRLTLRELVAGDSLALLSMLKDGKHLDQIVWSILRQDWYQAKAVWSIVLH